MPAAAPRSPRLPLLLAAAGLLALTFWLRAPGFGFKTWNVDEAIHAAIATTLRDGGVLYRDAIDQRTPLTYVALAGIFSVAGDNNLAAVHVGLALLIAATGWMLFVLARARAGAAAALWSGALYPLLGTAMFFVGDANAFVTEWFVAFFTAAAALCFFSSERPSRARLFAVGALISGAFLSKQPGALDLAAPALTLVWQLRRERAALARAVLALGAGFALPIAAIVAYYAARGALADAIFYTWTYNLRFYGPEISAADRLASAAAPFRLLAAAAPAVLAAAGLAFAVAVRALFTRATDTAADAGNALRVYLLAWTATSLAGAAAGGRGFDHYSIQMLPPLCLGAGWLLGHVSRDALDRYARLAARLAAAGALLLVLAGLLPAAVNARARRLPVDPSHRVAEFIAAHSARPERVFVWGYHPDIYLFADRRPASRFVYASFLTGLVPWTNVAPDRDTAYAIVPGAMETLLRDLRAARPAFIVDCSAGPNRFWNKYPLERFPALAGFIAENYLPVETAQFVAQGFRLFAIRDSFRAAPPALPAANPAAEKRDGSVGLFPDGVDSFVRVAAHDPAGRLVHVELRASAVVVAALSVAPGRDLTADFPLPPAGEQPVRLQAFARSADGAEFASAVTTLEPRPPVLPAERLAEFAVPCGAERVVPREVSAPFGANVRRESGSVLHYAHAPSRLLFALPDAAIALRGGCALFPGAYAADNPHPTDGADFRVDFISADGRRTTLWQSSLDPRNNPADRAVRPFRVALPPGPHRRLELVISPGRAGSASSDWACWADLGLETSH